MEDGLYVGPRVRVQEDRSESTREQVFSIRMGHNFIAELANRDWANALAEVIDSFIPPGTNLTDAERYVAEGMLSLKWMRFVLASVLERAADLELARGLEALTEPERTAHKKLAELFLTQAKVMVGSVGT